MEIVKSLRDIFFSVTVCGDIQEKDIRPEEDVKPGIYRGKVSKRILREAERIAKDKGTCTNAELRRLAPGNFKWQKPLF
ncbi:MAG: hypothetical protein V1858_04650 [Candidatus Gottesmanbacteria bacterium]